MESGKVRVQPEKVLGDIKASSSTKRAAETLGNCAVQLKDTALLSGRGKVGRIHCRKALRIGLPSHFNMIDFKVKRK